MLAFSRSSYVYPMRNVEEFIDRLVGAKFITMLDLALLECLL